MSASHIGGLHRPVQKLDDTLIFAVPRKAKMQASPSTRTISYEGTLIMIRLGALFFFPYRAEPVIQIPTDRDLCERSLRIIESVFSGDVYLGKHTLRPASVRSAVFYSRSDRRFGPCKKILSKKSELVKRP